MDALADKRPLAELFTELADETGTLVKKEIELAKTEMTAKAELVVKDALVVAAGGLVTLAGSLALFAALILALGTLMPLWIAALLVGVVLAAVGLAVIFGGIAALRRVDPTPHATVQTLKENRQWVREQVSR